MIFPRTEDIKNSKDEFSKIYTEYRKINQNRLLTYSELVYLLFKNLSIDKLKSNSKTFARLLKDIRLFLKQSSLI
jgi:hypothetical protein